jgi:solute:Na+ symporter, SSS family
MSFKRCCNIRRVPDSRPGIIPSRFLLYDWLGIDLTAKSNALLNTLELPPKIVTPFLVMVIVSWLTKAPPKESVDRYYIKMKVPVDSDPETDLRNLEAAYSNPSPLDHRKLFPGTNLEFQKPTRADWLGFVVCWLVCGLIIGLAMFVAQLGA